MDCIIAQTPLMQSVQANIHTAVCNSLIIVTLGLCAEESALLISINYPSIISLLFGA